MVIIVVGGPQQRTVAGDGPNWLMIQLTGMEDVESSSVLRFENDLVAIGEYHIKDWGVEQIIEDADIIFGNGICTALIRLGIYIREDPKLNGFCSPYFLRRDTIDFVYITKEI
jgi:hypothetical protein